MNRQTTFPYAMTLRLTIPMESELENLAYDWRLSKAGTIRRILGRAIAQAYQHKCSPRNVQIQGGAL
jgi:hypothetical protein